MFTYIKQYINLIYLSILVILSIYSVFLYLDNKKLKLDIKDKDIQINQLSLEIKNQNDAISKLNSDYNDKVKSFNIKYNDLLNNQKTKIEYISKQDNYKSPLNLTEIDASKAVINDFLKNRRGEK